MAITETIVNVNATVTQAPAAPQLQQAGAIVSCGGTTTTVNTYTYCANLPAVTAILSALGNYTEVTAMATTFFAQGTGVGVYVLEIGAGGGASATQIAALTTWIAANPNVFYAYLCPATWDATSSAATQNLAAAYASASSKTYFFVTITLANIAAYTAKSLFCLVKSPTAAGTEFQCAAPFYQWLAQTPAIASPAVPMAFRFMSGVTAWQQITSGGVSNVATINSILASFGNVIITASEGGLTNSMLAKGTMMDGNQAMFWYAVDWILIQAKTYLANAIINGSNTLSPVVYNQPGINALLAVANTICSSSVLFGLALTAVTTATPFQTYVLANPTNYAAGIYNGFACNVTPQLGFTSVTFNLAATNFVGK